VQSFPEIQSHASQLAATDDELKVSEIVDLLLGQGIAHGASDVHVEPTPSGLSVRYRIDGVLQPVCTAPKEIDANIVARIKVMSDLLTYRTDVPQEGRIDGARHGQDIDLRVSTFPTIHGEKAVVRIFDPAKREFAIHDLGFPDEALDMLVAHANRPQGVILLTGPSGSGKTTTIYAALRMLVASGAGTRNIVTVEDPVEYGIEGVTQTQINLPADLTFARALRSLLRQDPEVIMVGEIRDGETAGIAIEAGLTGHMVISTVHSGTACGVFGRLLDMGIEPFLITSSITLVAAQRLVRRLCDTCKAQTNEEEAYAGLHEHFDGAVWTPVGCDECVGTGYQGRPLLAEILTVEERIRGMILEKTDVKALEDAAIQTGMVPLLEHGISLVRAGETSTAELRRVLVV